jgi:hypothetical protein
MPKWELIMHKGIELATNNKEISSTQNSSFIDKLKEDKENIRGQLQRAQPHRCPKSTHFPLNLP